MNPKTKNPEGNKHGQLMALLAKAGFDSEKRHDLIYAWTKGRTESSAALTPEERINLIWKLQNDSSFANNVQNAATAMNEAEMKRKRSVVLSIAQRVGIHGGTDFKKFNAFMEKSSILKKRLNKYTLIELDELIQQFHTMEANFNRSAKNAGTKAWYAKYGIAPSSGN